MKNIKFSVLFLIVAILLSSCGISDIADHASEAESSYVETISSEERSSESSEEISDEPETEYKRKGGHYSTFEYERPDFDNFALLVSEATRLFNETAPAEEVNDAVCKANDMMYEMSTMATLLSVKQSLDTTDEWIIEENNFITEKFSEAQEIYYKMLAPMIDSYCDELVFKNDTEEEKEKIRKMAEVLDSETTEIKTELNDYQSRYKNINSEIVTVKGRRMTLAEVYEEYGYETYAECYNDTAAELYTNTVTLSKRLAEKYGYGSYAEYAYKEIYERDFTKEQAQTLRDAILKYVYPVIIKVYNNISKPSVTGDFEFLSNDELLTEYFNSINPEMADAYSYLKKNGLYLRGSDDKAESGAYTTFLYDYDSPIIYQKCIGTPTYGNLQTFIHEFGHFYVFYEYGDDTPSSIDILEIQSQANELLFLKNFESIVGKDDAATIESYELFGNMSGLLSVCVFSEFEDRVFESDCKTAEDYNKIFSSLAAKYHMNYSENYWMYVHHFFLYPMYYISYGTSSIAALLIYSEFTKDEEKGIEFFNATIEQMQNTDDFSELLSLAGLPSSFEEKTIKDMATAISARFDELFDQE